MFALVDCNNFYASCERVFNPALNHKPIVVLSNNDGCVIARSNEAKKIGIKMGEPAFKIKHIIRHHHVQTFSTNFALYGDMSQRVMNILSSIIPSIEIYSIDEAFLDLRDFNHHDIFNICAVIRKKILTDTGIPVSIGIGRTKTLSKIANYISKRSEKDKGVFMLTQNKEDKILSQIAVENIWGVGRKLKIFLQSYRLETAKQLRDVKLIWARSKITVVGEKMVKELRGESCYDIQYLTSDKKSICTSRTFGNMVNNLKDLSSSIAMYTTRCAEKLRAQNSCAILGHIFITSNRFRKDLPYYAMNKVIKFSVPTSNTGEIISHMIKALQSIYKKGYQYKQAGVILSGLIPSDTIQQNLFDSVDRNKINKIMKTVDIINKKMGRDTIRYAIQNYTKKYSLKQQRLSPCYTTRWKQLLTIKL